MRKAGLNGGANLSGVRLSGGGKTRGEPACGCCAARRVAPRNPAVVVAFFLVPVFLLAIVPLIIALCRRAATILRVYSNRITLERGLFSKCYQDFIPRDIRSIDVDQSFLQRLVGIGDITISTAATVEAAEKIEGIPDPKGVRELILAQRGEK